MDRRIHMMIEKRLWFPDQSLHIIKQIEVRTNQNKPDPVNVDRDPPSSAIIPMDDQL
jgi:hypothetical protein